jgi:hypothetical protein
MNTPLTFSTAASPDQKNFLTKKIFPLVKKTLPIANQVLPVAASFVPALRPVAAVVGAVSSIRR